MVLDGHGAVLQPCKSKQYDDFVSKLEKHFVGRKYKLPSGFYFSYPIPIMFIIVVLLYSFAIFFFTKLEMFKMDKYRNEHLPSKNHEITKLDKSLSICGVVS